MNRTIKHTFQYPHSPKVVWEYLTQPELIAQWLMPNDFKAIVGHNFQFKTRPIPNFDFDGNIYCRVLEIIPLKKLVYSWTGGPGDGKINLDSVVSWTLTPKGDSTELHLEHSGLMENINIYNAMNEGWLKNGNKIDELINTAAHGTPKA
ncbi:MAG TPA: SRPBCC domain-containing protein [Puia sp.]|nr:SRPBCC domain-containing protein [Puia sp.]